MGNEEMFELTTPQKSIWTMEQFYKGTNINNICATLIINMDVDLEKLNEAINIFIQNNKSFGLNFCIRNGEIKQFFRKYEKINFECIKLKNKKEVKKLAQETAEELFNIEGEKLFKFKLVKLENNYGGFVVMTHHLISDAATMSMIGKEVTEIYSKLISNESIERKEYSYEQYIYDEKQYLSSPKFEKDKQYWIEKYKTVPEVAMIPTTLENSKVNTNGKSKREEFVLNEKILTKISQLCNKNKISNFNFFIAIYAIYLGRVSNLNDFVIGTPILNRTNFKEKHTTGMFINTAPLRIKIEENIDFISFVKSIAQSSMSMLRYQKYSYQMLLEELRKTNKQVPTLYDVMLSYQVTKANDKDSKIPYEVEWLPTTTISNGIDIHLHDNDDGGILNVAYDYQVEKYTKQDIINIHNRILHIIEQVLENENCLERDIEIVIPEEKNQILNVFNDTYVDYPRDETIVNLFEEQVEKTPNNVAVVCGDEQITYKELNEKANSLAHYLVECGVKANTVVGILINRSIEMIIAILATLKSGGVYIPIDPEYPESRVKYMLEDSGCKILLSSQKIFNKLNIDIQYIDISIKESEIYKNNVDNLKANIEQEHLSYIIYTSGSTGKPKGVMLTHKGLNNLVNYCNNYVEYLKNNKYQSIVSVTTISFDIFFFESIISLQKGLRLVIANEEEQMIPRLLVNLIQKEDIKIIQTTPSRMKLLLNNINSVEDIKNLQYIILAGEQFPISLKEELKRIKGVTIYNGYGPSETTVFSTLTDVTDASEMTIGRPLNNTQIYVLDKKMNICPIEIPGEIYISGDGVGKGYINKEELTKNSYIENKFNKNSLLYKTGDLGAYNEDGTLKCLGRIDNQVKIRGQRIELEEIENAILKIEQIKNCAVVKKQDENSHEYLCAYYTKKLEIEKEEIRKILQKTLTNYMIPQYFMELEKLPYTPNGKIDRKELIKLKEKKTIYEKSESVKSEIDIFLKKLLAEVLKQDSIQIENTFFELGGDSLTAIELVTRIYNELKVEISIKEILNSSSIEQIIEAIKNKRIDNKVNKIIKIENKEIYNTSSAQKRIYYASQIGENKSTLYNISGGVILNKVPDINKLEKTINELIKRHSILRTYFELQDGKIMQKIAEECNFKLNVIEENIDNLEEIFTKFVKPFELLKTQLFRFELAILKNKKAFLMLDMHHSISDGTSLNILLKELCNIYNGAELTKDVLEYKDFAEWEYEKIEKGEFKQAEKYWKEQFKDEVPTLNMPTTYKRDNEKSFTGSSEYKKINQKLNKKINQIANQLNCTPYMIYLAAYYILLYRYTDQKDIIVGTPISGRYLPELENMVGMFVNTLALRNKINVNSSFEEYINSIKTMCLNAYENQEYPFELINEKLDIQREDGKRRLFDTMFIFQNNGYPKFKLNDIDAQYYIPNSHVSKFDISLELTPNDKDSIEMRVEYSTELFDKEFARDFGEHYIKILQEASENIKIKVKDIEILTIEEKNILKKFNNTTVEYPKDKTVIKIFEENAKMYPNRTAIVFKKQNITYKELNEKANALAKQLILKNVTPQNVVGILLSRSEKVIVSILATLKTGCAYMLIDPNLPDDRIKYMLLDSNAIALITEENARHIKFKNKIFVDKSLNNQVENLNIKDDIENSFSIIYTSGSTGKPKGVMLTNKGVINMVLSYQEILNTDICKTFLSMSTVSFDMFMVETMVPLLTGKTIILTTEEEQKIPLYTSNLMLRYNVDFMLTTPSRIELFLANKLFECLKHAKIIQLGGEVLTIELKNRLQEQTKANLYNGYGPTEITACCSSKKVEDYVSIGTPFCNTQIYILNEENKICPINIPGEICIVGDGVGQGYINNPTRTQKTFIKNPFGEGIMYKTGDLGRINSKGELKYIDRKDSQIKIRGLRVELSEIEKQILNTIELKGCTVIYKKDKGYISAFISADKKIDITEARKKLAQKLPLYMIPKYITQLEEIPLTRNGKVNKKLLETYEEDKADKSVYVEPNTEQEKLFCTIWEKLLNTRIGIDSDIFECGADSLLAIKFKTELLAYDIEIPYADLFKYKTVRSLCKNSKIKENENSEKYDYTNINKILERNIIKNLKEIVYQNNTNVLLFGATGFVGMHIIENFIKNDKGKIYCIVRDKNNKSAQERFIDILHFYFGTKLDKYLGNRIIVIKGDVLKESFELSNRNYKKLIYDIDVVINSAAIVKHYGDEQKFIEINVNSTQNIINFCLENDKRLVHISSLSVSGNASLDGSIEDRVNEEKMTFAETDLYKGQKLTNVYLKSKFMAERLILENIDKGLKAQILRLGNITNRFSDGVFQINPEENAFVARIRSMLKLKMLPEYLMKEYIEFTPVDICAEVIIKIMQNYEKNFVVYHIYNNEHVYFEKLKMYLDANNVNIEVVKHSEFKQRIKEILQDNRSEILSGIINDFDKDKRLTYSSNIQILSEFTRAFLYKIGFSWPKIDEKYIEKYIKYLKKIKFL